MIKDKTEECERKIMKIVKGERKYCELCGIKLKVPETDYSKIAICDKCLKGQMYR